MQGFVVFLFFYQPQKFARAGNVAAFTYVYKVALGSNYLRLKSGKAQIMRFGHRNMRRFPTSVIVSDKRAVLCDIFICCSTTSADYIDQSFIYELFYLYSHISGCLVVLTHCVWKPGVGISRYVIRCYLCQPFDERFHVACSERAVQTNRKYVGMAYRSEKRFQGLPRKSTPGFVGKRNREHYWNAALHCAHGVFRCKKGCFCIKGIKNCLNKEHIHSTLKQSDHLLFISRSKFVESKIPQCRIIDIRT